MKWSARSPFWERDPHLWFAWYPVRALTRPELQGYGGAHIWVWLEPVCRQCLAFENIYHTADNLPDFKAFERRILG